MDRPDCSLKKLYRTLDQFGWINILLSRYRTLLSRHVIRDMLHQPEREWRLVDLGAGACDITVWMLRQAANLGLRLKVTALERDPRVITYARAKHRGVDGLTVAAGDALDPDSWEPVDYVVANHFLHHLTNGEIVRVLRLVAEHTSRVFVLNDILRSPLAYAGYALLMGPFAGRSFALADGLMSIRRGFLPPELRSLVQTAGLEETSCVKTLHPFRVALVGGPAFTETRNAVTPLAGGLLP
jgi:2-polyprenyl-3-methyl-5-hydroxy-6-metoxy-1,4-benzoquinol methylase